MINEQQWLEITKRILQFNRLVTTEQERKSEEYIIKCFKLTDDEIEEYLDSIPNSEEELKEMADIVVTSVQALDAITPSFLKWEYIQSRVNAVIEDQDTRLVTNNISNLIAMVIVNAEEAGYDLYGATMAVNKSNMSKVVTIDYFPSRMFEWASFPTIAKEIEKKNNGRYTGVVGKIHHPEGYEPAVVFRDCNLKVVKGPCYFEPDLKPFISNKTGE